MVSWLCQQVSQSVSQSDRQTDQVMAGAGDPENSDASPRGQGKGGRAVLEPTMN